MPTDAVIQAVFVDRGELGLDARRNEFKGTLSMSIRCIRQVGRHPPQDVTLH